jgi:O-antigen/teichoic acid export membrane protein
MSAEAMTKSETPALGTAYRHMVRGAWWSLVARWSVRGIGLVNTVILARLLTPADFGIVAMAMVVRGLLDNLTRVGVAMMVIRDPDTTDEFNDSAWTMQILQGAFIGAILAAAGPLAASYYGEPRVIPVMNVLALTAFASGWTNIGVILLRKDLEFAQDFNFQIASRFATFAVTVAAAFALRSYWAIVLGQLAGQVLTVAISFVLHPYRPRLSLRRGGDFLKFGASVIPYNLAFFLTGKADVLLVGRIASAAVLGAYSVASELAGMLTRELVATVGRGLLPNYAKLTHDRSRLSEAYLIVLNATWMLSVALGIGLAAVGPEFVRVVLGEKWMHALPFLRWLALYSVLGCLLETMSGHILIVMGRERLSAILTGLRLLALMPFILAAARTGNPETVAASAVLSSVIAFPPTAFYLVNSLGTTHGELLSALWRPVVAGAAMVGAVLLVPATGGGALLGLVLKSLAGGAVYVLTLVGCWALSGRPHGPERLLLNFARERRWIGPASAER